MTRRAVPICSGWFAGLFLSFVLCINGPVGIYGCALFAAFCAFLAVLAVLLKISFRPRAMLFLTAFACASLYSCLTAAWRLMPLEALDGRTVTVSGYVEDYSESDRSAVTVRGRVNGIPARFVLYVSDFRGDFGDRLSATAKISKLEDSPFFRERSSYLPQGVFLTASAVDGVKTERSPFSLLGYIRRCSLSVSKNIRRSVPGEPGQLLAAMVCGDRTAYSDSLRFRLNRSGIGHLAAVSGLHVSIVALGVMSLCKKLRFSRGLSAVMTEAVAILFVIFSGARVSAVRAGLMMTFYIASTLFKRRPDPLNTLCIVGAAMTVFEPFAAADSSLLLSLSGVFGVSVMSRAVSDGFGIKRRLPRLIVTSACVSLATAPFAALFFNGLSLASPVMNLAAIPLSTASLILGMLFALTGCRAVFLIKLSGYLSGLTVSLADAVSKLGFTYIPLGRTLPAALLGVCAVFSIAIFLIAKSPKRAALFAAFCFSLIAVINSAVMLYEDKNLYLTVFSRKDYRAAVLRKGGESIIIDFDGGMSGYVEGVLERTGVISVEAVFLGKGAEAAYPEYAKMQPEPEKIFLPDGAYVFADRSVEVIKSGAVISCLSEEILVSDGGISFDAFDGSGEVTLLNGLTVIEKGGSKTVLKGDIIKEIKIGG